MDPILSIDQVVNIGIIMGITTTPDFSKTICIQYRSLIVDPIFVIYQIANIGSIMGIATISNIVKTICTQYWLVVALANIGNIYWSFVDVIFVSLYWLHNIERILKQ